MKKRFTITSDVHGVFDGREYQYTKGAVTPADEAERAVVEHLVGLGVAKPEKKEA